MGLTLEVKKFVNSEHTGEYMEIDFPHELALRAPRAAKAEPDAEAAAPAPTSETVYEKIKLHYLEGGSGEPLMLIHTVGQSLYTWRKLFDRLCAHYRVFALDLPGFGYSDRPAEFGYTIEDYSDAIRLFMDAAGLKSAHFLAFSLGCAYAVRLALDHPERIGRMVLLSPGGMTGDMPLTVRLIDSPILGLAASRLYRMRTVENLLSSAMFDLTNITPDVVQEYYRPASDGLARRAARLALQRYDDASIIASLRSLAAPVLLLHGSEDKWHAPNDAAELYHAAIRDAGFGVIRNAGHLLHEEKPDRVLSALLEFIPVVMPGDGAK